MLAGGSDPARYYLARRTGCAVEYYTGAGGRAGVWAGADAAAADLAGELDGEGERVLRALLDGHARDGRVLVAPVLRADPAGGSPPARSSRRSAPRPTAEAVPGRPPPSRWRLTRGPSTAGSTPHPRTGPQTGSSMTTCTCSLRASRTTKKWVLGLVNVW